MNYNKDYWIKRYKDKGGYKTVGQSSWTNEQYKAFIDINTPFFKKIITTHCKLTSVLDFGCGIGRWVPLLTSLFTNYEGVDIIEFPIQQARQIYPKNTFTLIEGVSCLQNLVDNIWTIVTLQHVIDIDLLDLYIKQFYKILSNKGICIITENSSGDRTNNYMAFRPVKLYIDLFEKNNFKLVSQYDKVKGHNTLVFERI